MTLQNRAVRTFAYTLILMGATALAGCGSDTGSSESNAALADSAKPASFPIPNPTKTSYPLTIDNCGIETTFSAPPKRVVILSGYSVGEAETFVLMGLQDRVVANDQGLQVSDDPTMLAAFNKLPKGGLTRNENRVVPAEEVLGLKADLVISPSAGGFDAKRGAATREQLATAGAETYVHPANCSAGESEARRVDNQAYERQSIASSYEFILQIGQIFDHQQRATDLVRDLQRRVDAVEKRVQGKSVKKVLLAYPSMTMMNVNGLPAVFSGGVYDDIIRAAGGENSFASDKPNPDLTSNINAEALASAKVDVLVIGVWQQGEDAQVKSYADELFKKYPQWNASKTRTYVTLHDGAWLGPMNVTAVEKLADAVHPA